jgi:hypothetical protein
MSQVAQAMAGVLSYLIGGWVWLQDFVALLLAAAGFTATTQGVYLLFNSLLFTTKQSFKKCKIQCCTWQLAAKPEIPSLFWHFTLAPFLALMLLIPTLQS